MEYSYESQEKALKFLIKNAPHDIEKFRNLYHVEIKGKRRAIISLRDILFSDVWTADEKEELIKLYEHNDEKKDSIWNSKTDEDKEDIGYYTGIEGFPLIDECIKHHNFSGVQALLNLGNHISVATISRIIKYISDPAERYKYCELIVNYYKNQETIKVYQGNRKWCKLIEIPSLCDCYVGHTADWEHGYWKPISSMRDICYTNDVELVKLFLETVKNINPLFQYAIESKNIEIVKLFIDKGADVNFQNLEFDNKICESPSKTPIKLAIDLNDFEMVKFLHQNGANLNFVDKSEKMQEFIRNLGEKDKETHQYIILRDRLAYVTWTKTPLEYAINVGPASIINSKFDYSTTKDYEERCKNRMQIVNYLYENGATFDEGEINYTDLICYAMKADDFEATNYYFEEAFKKGKNIDFEKIVRFIHQPGYIYTSSDLSIKGDKYHYKDFKEGAISWFRLCEKFLKQTNQENKNQIVKLMLEKIFCEFSSRQFNEYRELIVDLSNSLPKEILKEIPAVFEVSFENLEEILSLGYDINCIKNNRNILMKYIANEEVNTEILSKLLSFGLNINYLNPFGKSSLSYAIERLYKYDFYEATIKLYDKDIKSNQFAEADEKVKIVKKLIELSSPEVIMSKAVKEAVYEKIAPGPEYSQMIYFEILKALTQKGFKVDDDYVRKSIKYISIGYIYDPYYSEIITNPWGYLWDLYSMFDNKFNHAHVSFPIEKAKTIKYGTEESNNLFLLISEHLKRNFVTSIEDIEDFDKISNKEKELQHAQDVLLQEISNYIGYLDYRQIMALIDQCPIIDIASLSRTLLRNALNSKDNNLCKQLIKRGATIVCPIESDDDLIPDDEYSENLIKRFYYISKKINSEKSPEQEYEDLLVELGYKRNLLKKME